MQSIIQNDFFPKFSNWQNTHTHTNVNMINKIQNQLKIVRYPSYSQLLTHSYHSPRSSPPHTKRDIPPRLPTKKQRSQSLTPIQPGQTMTARSTVRNLNGKYCSADGVVTGEYFFQILSYFLSNSIISLTFISFSHQQEKMANQMEHSTKS